MTTPVTIRIRQQGIVRANGYQATQWAVTVPTIDPPATPAIATSPLSYAPLFVIRQVAGLEFLERVATLSDFVAIPQSELQYFDAMGAEAETLYNTAQAGDTLRITTTVAHWTDGIAPYTDQDFVVAAAEARFTGAVTTTSGSPDVVLTGYQFRSEDVGRLILITGSPGSDGYYSIVSGAGPAVRVGQNLANTGTFTATLMAVRINPGTVGVAEPRYFPTRETWLNWELRRGPTLLVSGSGGRTLRGSTADLVRSIRNTTLSATLTDATNLFLVTQRDVATLQAAAEIDNTAFTVLTTYTVGP